MRILKLTYEVRRIVERRAVETDGAEVLHHTQGVTAVRHLPTAREENFVVVTFQCEL